MTEKITVITDSGSDVPADIAQELGIKIIPLQINYKDRSYRDGVDIDSDAVYARLSTEVPTTSLPKGEDILELLKQLEREGTTHVLAVVLSSGLSGTYNLMRLMATETNVKMAVLDTKNIGIGSGMSAIAAARMVKAGKSFEEILSAMPEVIRKTKVFFVLQTLEYLQKGGRIGKVTAIVGTAFDLKPIITCNAEGIYTTVTKARGRKLSLNRLKELILEQAQGASSYSLAFAHGMALEELTKLKADLSAKLPGIKETYVGPCSPALGVHTGPGLLGIAIQIHD
jgi:DegV family protein with EDD domain